MIRRTGMIIAWVVATIAATGIAVAAVRSVADQVVDQPPAATAATSSSSGSSATSSSNGGSVTSSSNGGSVTSSSNGGTVTSSTNGGSVTSSSSGGTSTSTTKAPAPVATATATYNLVGGWVTIAYGPGIVELVSAAPNPGFSIEVKESGPDRVEVEFESDEHDSEFRADETSSGAPEIEIEEKD